MAISGKRPKRWVLRLWRWDFTLRTFVYLGILVVLLAGAVIDVTNSAKVKEQRVQESELRGQLAEFLLSIREPDGSSLLENPPEFSAASRPLGIVSLRRSFFTYLLQRANARAFQTGDISFEAPRACQVEFPGAQTSGPQSGSLHACFAAVPGDPTGRYVYFSLRYPSSSIERHRTGQPLSSVNRVVVTFKGVKETKLTLTYQVPPLARSRYPSQLARFAEVHELSGFVSSEGGQPSRLVNGQAFERRIEEGGNAAKNFVTVVGRIDAAILQPTDADEEWPSGLTREVSIGLKVYDKAGDNGESAVAFDVPPGKAGTPLVSLTQAYLAAVPSRASLRVNSAVPGDSQRVVWRSEDAEIGQSTVRLDGSWQSLADFWTRLIVSESVLRTDEQVSVTQIVRMGGANNLSATLTATPFTLPDLAARAFVWVSAALSLICLMTVDWGLYIWKLAKLRGEAYAMVVRRPGAGEQALKQSAGKNEIGTLSRVFYLLLRRNRSRNENLVKRIRAQEASRTEGLRLAEAHIQSRKSILDAIGHEIRAPLQSLLNTTKDDDAVQEKLARIRCAVEALSEATSVEDGLRSGEIAMEQRDLTDWLKRSANNLTQDGKPVVYVGPETEVIVDMDPLQLWRILDNLLENAERYRTPGTNIELRLSEVKGIVKVAVFNHGLPIPESDLDRIFDLGVSDSLSQGGTGLGLFASRIYGLAMKLTLHAQNEEDGVSLVLQFPPRAAD